MLIFDLFELLQAQFALVLKHQTIDKLKFFLVTYISNNCFCQTIYVMKKGIIKTNNSLITGKNLFP